MYTEKNRINFELITDKKCNKPHKSNYDFFPILNELEKKYSMFASDSEQNQRTHAITIREQSEHARIQILPGV